MRDLTLAQLFALISVLALSANGLAQAPQAQKQAPAYISEGVPAMPNPPGPAPTHDLTGAWIGPLNQTLVLGPFPDMTPAGEARFKLNRPIIHVGDSEEHLAPTTDPFIACDPLGFPRVARLPTQFGHGALRFQPMPNGMLIVYELQRVWREVAMDGRQLPAKVDAAGFPDSSYYGYS